jgi:hypothetical protein
MLKHSFTPAIFCLIFSFLRLATPPCGKMHHNQSFLDDHCVRADVSPQPESHFVVTNRGLSELYMICGGE